MEHVTNRIFGLGALSVIGALALGMLAGGPAYGAGDGSGAPDVKTACALSAARIAPTSLSFSGQKVGTTSAPQTVTLTALPESAHPCYLNISGISIVGGDAGDFAYTTTCGANLAPGASCTFHVTFAPKATGTRTAYLSVADNSSNPSPQTTSVAGVGQ